MSDLKSISIIEHDTVQTTVTNRLRKLILTQKVKPGERLVQDELAQQLGVSRTPVREAIRQLESENLVTILPYKGAAVSQVSANALEGIYQVRIALEMHASRLAIQQLKDKDVEVLRRIVADMRQALKQEDPEALLKSNQTFYEYFYKLAQQPEVFDLIMSYIDKSKRFRQQHFYDQTLALRTVTLHEDLVEMIAARDEAAVLNQTHKGLETVATELINSLKQESSSGKAS